MARVESIQRLRRISLFTLLAGAAGLGVVWSWLPDADGAGRAVLQPTVSPRALQESAAVGDVVDVWRGVPVRANGQPYHRSHGRHVAADGYYYGRMWQCVEYVKRFYYDRLGHGFPDGMGHAKSFFDPAVPHGGWNAQRGLRQFVNGAGERPRLDDLVVWTSGTFGHVAVVGKVGGDFVEVVQQNVREGSRMRLCLAGEAEGYRMGGEDGPAGFLRRAAD